MLFFGCAVLFFAVGTSPQTFIDPDAYYHMTITQIMLDQRTIVTDFQWLQFTTLTEAFVDHHLLYHLLLLPFVAAFGQTVGLKIATALLGGAVMTVFYLLLKNRGVSFASVWCVLLLCFYDFSFRMSLGKANSLSLIFLLVGFVLLCTKQYRAIALVSFFYVWAYGGFAQLLIMSLLYALLELVSDVRKNGWPSLQKMWNLSRLPRNTTLGMIAGLIIHPSFPQNISFLWEQFFHIGVINYQDSIGVGGEWYPYGVSELFFLSLPLTAIALLAIALTFIYRKSWRSETLLAGAMAIFFLGLSLKSRRYIEYAIPWTVLWTALTAHHAGSTEQLRTWMLKRFRRGGVLTRSVLGTCAIVAMSGVFILGLSSLSSLERQYTRGIPFSRMSGVGTWLEHNAPRNALIFHDDWDVFPLLFHHAPSMRYIVGLDPTFMYRFDPDMYRTWVAVTQGAQTADLHATIKEDFGASYVVIDHDHIEMRRSIVAAQGFALVYEDGDGAIYAVEE